MNENPARLELWNLILVALGIVVFALLKQPERSLSCGVGGLVASLNLWLIRLTVQRLANGELKRFAVLIVGKLILTILVVGLAIIVLKLESIGLLAGLSTLVVTVITYGALQPKASD